MLNTWRGIVRDLTRGKGGVVNGRRGVVAEGKDGGEDTEVEKEKGMRELVGED